jgi:ankyrin repeat protein
LLEKGATNIDSADCEGDTALHIAVRNNNASIFNLLVAHGASIHLKNKNGCSPLVLVKRHDDSEILEADHFALVKHYKRGSGFFSKTPQEESTFYKRIVITTRHH